MRSLRNWLLLLLSLSSTGLRAQKPASGPSSIPDLILYLRADQGVFQSGTRAAPGPPCVAPGDPVGLWLDESGHNNDAIQPLPAAQPTFVPSFFGYPEYGGVRMPAIALSAPSPTRATGTVGMQTSCEPDSTFTLIAIYASDVSDTRMPRCLVQGSKRWFMGPYQNAYQAHTGAAFTSTPVTCQQGTVVIQTVTQNASTVNNYVMGILTGSALPYTAPGRLALGATGMIGYPAESSLIMLIVYSRVLGSGDLLKLYDWAAGVFGTRTCVVYSGNSLTYGTDATAGQLSLPPTPASALLPQTGTPGATYPDQTIQALLLGGVSVGPQFDYGVPGSRGRDLAAAQIATSDLVIWPTIAGLPGRKAIAPFWEITNDICDSTAGPSSTTIKRAYDAVVRWCRGRHRRGCIVIALTCLPRTKTYMHGLGVDGAADNAQSDADFESDRNAVNALLRADSPTPVPGLSYVYTGSSYCDYLLDVAADTRIGFLKNHEVNHRYYADSHVHLNDLGYGIIASYMAPLLHSILSGP